MLFVSSDSAIYAFFHYSYQFQSRNRDAFRFKLASTGDAFEPDGFQSRNRDAFRFKFEETGIMPLGIVKFQSRNRDAFRFKFTYFTRVTTSRFVSIS